MRTVLIVEDERNIRRGFRVTIQRSGIPVEAILECDNGMEALEILKEHPVDVMFTDIQMPGMDGVELVRRVNLMEHRPAIVVVSGHDDFAYAVEMLRNGVKEYLLKPVGVDQILAVLRKLEEELVSNAAVENARRTVSRRRLSTFLAGEDPEDPDYLQFVEDNRDYFLQGAYRVCVFPKEVPIEPHEFLILIEGLGDSKVCILKDEHLLPFQRNEAAEASVGISTLQTNMGELIQAYLEAKRARRAAFCQGHTLYAEELDTIKVPQALVAADAYLLAEGSHSRRINLIGTDRVPELIEQWKKLFGAAASLHMTPEQFEKEIHQTLGDLVMICSSQMLEEDKTVLEALKAVFAYNSLNEYQDEWMNWLLELNRRFQNLHEEGSSQNRMKQAVAYIEENYQNDLNMAVVSNYISMNYSLFSYEFKRYTGSNFVNFLKDLRIRRAKELLTNTDMKILEVSRSVGYDNEKHFMKIFKSVCGVSPSEYRRMHSV